MKWKRDNKEKNRIKYMIIVHLYNKKIYIFAHFRKKKKQVKFTGII